MSGPAADAVALGRSARAPHAGGRCGATARAPAAGSRRRVVTSGALAGLTWSSRDRPRKPSLSSHARRLRVHAASRCRRSKSKRCRSASRNALSCPPGSGIGASTPARMRSARRRRSSRTCRHRGWLPWVVPRRARSRRPGLTVAAKPAGRVDSEGLLQLPRVQRSPRPARADPQRRRRARPAGDGTRQARRERAHRRTVSTQHGAAGSICVAAIARRAGQRRESCRSWSRARKFSRPCCRLRRPTISTRSGPARCSCLARALPQRPRTSGLDRARVAGNQRRGCRNAESRAGRSGPRTGRVLGFRPQHGRAA